MCCELKAKYLPENQGINFPGSVYNEVALDLINVSFVNFRNKYYKISLVKRK